MMHGQQNIKFPAKVESVLSAKDKICLADGKDKQQFHDKAVMNFGLH
jgi:hypothetical protein